MALRVDLEKPEEASKERATALFWRRFVVILLVAVFALGAIPFAIRFLNLESQKARAREVAITAFRAGQWDDAIRLSQKWVEQFPNVVEAHETQLKAGLQAKRLSVAIDAAKALLQITPSNSDLRESLVLWLFLTGSLEEADRLCQKALADNPSRENLLQLHADILLRLGESVRATDLLDRMLASGKKSPQILTMRGSLYLEAGDFSRAVAMLQEAASLSGQPTEKNLHYLALALARSGDAKGAETIFAQLRSRQEIAIWEKYGHLDSISYKFSLAESLIHLGKREEALGLLAQIRQEAPDNPYLVRLMAAASALPGTGGK